MVTRYGGDEFVVVLPETDREGAADVPVPAGEETTPSGVTYPTPAAARADQRQFNETATPAITAAASRLTWEGVVQPQKWMNFYTMVLTRFASRGGLNLTVRIEVEPEGGLSKQDVDDTRIGLRDLGLGGEVETE